MPRGRAPGVPPAGRSAAAVVALAARPETAMSAGKGAAAPVARRREVLQWDQGAGERGRVDSGRPAASGLADHSLRPVQPGALEQGPGWFPAPPLRQSTRGSRLGRTWKRSDVASCRVPVHRFAAAAAALEPTVSREGPSSAAGFSETPPAGEGRRR